MKKFFSIISIILIIVIGYNSVGYIQFTVFTLKNRKVPENYIHFSVDDVVEVFEDLYENESKYQSIFDNNFLKVLFKFNKQYGLKVSLYCYYEDNGFTINNISEKFKKEFANNSDWLRLGFHSYSSTDDLGSISYNDFKNGYLKFESFLNECNCKSDSFLRLSYFKGNENVINFLESDKSSTYGLYTADDDRNSYNLKNYENNFIMQNDYYVDSNDLCFVHTDFRLEKDFDLSVWFESNNSIVEFFTHEWAFNGLIISRLEEVCLTASDKGYEWSFGEDMHL